MGINLKHNMLPKQYFSKRFQQYDEDDINLKILFDKMVVAFILYGKLCIFFLRFQTAHLKVKLHLCVKRANI
jgi:hypothetical protein